MPEPNREREIFEAALELPSAEERLAYVDRACGDDPALAERIVRLLGRGADEGFLPDDPQTKRDGAALVEGPGTVIDRYRLLEQIGEGGFGVVYLTEQLEPVKRRIALKIIKPGMDSKQVIARFEAERQALALMDHPNIAQVFDAGATDSGRPYFVMELVQGIPITQFCREQKLDLPKRLNLFIDVCQAVQHAHQKGVIHRDLKPTNVLVTLHGDRAVPKVIDFGIAKATEQPLTERTLFTQFQQFLGTPAYMSPEQAALSGLDVDTRSDVYSLGVLLYELLTGSPPFESERLLSAGLDEMRRILREEEPQKPTTRISQSRTQADEAGRTAPPTPDLKVTSELDWIVLKALEKDRDRRYETANGLAADLRRYLADEPVSAVAPSFGYQLGKFARRHKAFAGATGAVLLALTLGTIGTIAGVIRARDSAEQARHAESRANRLAYQSLMFLVSEAESANNYPVGRQLLLKTPPSERGWEWRHFQARMAPASVKLEGHADWIGRILFTEDEEFVLSIAFDGRAILHRVRGGPPLWRSEAPSNRCLPDIALSPDPGRAAVFWGATGSEDEPSILGRIDLATGRIEITQRLPAGEVQCAAFDSSGGRLAYLARSGGETLLHLVETDRGVVLSSTPIGPGHRPLVFSPDGRFLAYNLRPRTNVYVLTVYDLVQEEEIARFDDVAPECRAIAFSHDTDGTTLLFTDQGGLYSGSLDTGETEQLVPGTSGCRRGSLNDRNGLLAYGTTSDGIIHIEDRKGENAGLRIPAGALAGGQIVTSPTGRYVAASHAGRALHLWDTTFFRDPFVTARHSSALGDIALAPDGRLLLTASWTEYFGGESEGIRLWDPASGRLLDALELPPDHFITGFGVSSDGRLLAARLMDVRAKAPMITLWDIPSRKVLSRWQEEPLFLTTSPSFYPNSERLLVASPQGIRIADARTGRTLHERDLGPNWGPRGILLAPDGETAYCVVRGEDLENRVLIVDGHTLETRHSLPLDAIIGHDAPEPAGNGDGLVRVGLTDIALRNGADDVALALDTPVVAVLSRTSGEVLARLRGHTAQVLAATFNPDGTRLVTGSRDRTIRIWETTHYQCVGVLHGHGGHVHVLEFTPDGRLLFSASGDGTVRVWGPVTKGERAEAGRP